MAKKYDIYDLIVTVDSQVESFGHFFNEWQDDESADLSYGLNLMETASNDKELLSALKIQKSAVKDFSIFMKNLQKQAKDVVKILNWAEKEAQITFDI